MIGFYVLNSSYEQIDILDPLNVQWITLYYEAGKFSIQVLARDYSKDWKYIITSRKDNNSTDRERYQVGKINKVLYEIKTTSKYVQIEGFFLEKELNKKVLYPTIEANNAVLGTWLTNVMNNTINLSKYYPYRNATVPQFRYTLDNTLRIDKQVTGAYASDFLYEILKQYEASYRANINIYFDDSNKAIVSTEVVTFKGKDRTSMQIINEPLIFSTSFGNLKDGTSFVTDDSDYKTKAIVAGGGEGSERIWVTVGDGDSELWVDAKDISFDTTKLTLEQYKDLLMQRGKEKLLEHVATKNITVNVSTSTYEYLKDFDIGDIADVIIEDLELSFKARIIGIYEVWKAGKYSIELEFGDKIYTDYEKVRLDK